MDKIGMMATYPPRKECLKQTLPRILPQLDKLYLYCNQYGAEDLSELGNWIRGVNSGCYVKLIDPSFTEDDVQDMGKFWAAGVVSGFTFLLDDDLAYPANYCKRHLQAIAKHGKVSAVHGRVVTEYPLRNYFGDTRSFHYRQPLKKSCKVDVAGTGTVAFATHLLPMSLYVDQKTMLRFRGLADIWFACLMRIYKMDIICLSRKGGWLDDVPAASQSHSLYAKTKDDTSIHCKYLNRLNWSND